MVQRDTLITALNKYLNTHLFTDYCPIGLQVEGAKTLRKVATGVSLSMELLERTVEIGAQMAIVHHGMFWKNQSPVLQGPLRERIAYLLEHDLSLVGYHLPLDAHRVVGNNAQILKFLGAIMKEAFGEYNGMPIGFVGEFERAKPVTKIMERLRVLSPGEHVFFPGSETKIKRFGVVSGGAGSIYEQAVAAGLDLFITGEPYEPALALARESGTAFLAIGHYNSEKPGVMALGSWLKRKFKIDVQFIDIPNPA